MQVGIQRNKLASIVCVPGKIPLVSELSPARLQLLQNPLHRMLQRHRPQ